MRTIVRALINLTFMAIALAADAALITQQAYLHASHDARIAILAAPAAASLVLACVALHLVPSKARLKAREQLARPSFTYAPAKRGR